MTSETADELAEAERRTRMLLRVGWTEMHPDDGELIMAEYDRRGRVEKAAAALIKRWDNGDFRVGPVGNALLTALTDALNGAQP